MLISCEKCATTYMLDDRLIPSGGAPVQCTRCSHVFTARPPSAPTPQPEAQGDGGAPGSTGGTKLFGLPQLGRNTTQVFGAAPASQPSEATQPYDQVELERALHRADGGQSDGASAAPHGAPGALADPRSTMAFGTAAPPAQPRPPSRSSGPPFGTPGPAGTAMFGAPAAPSGSPFGTPGPAGTAMFGTPAAPAAPPPGAPGLAGTAMFGTPVVPAAPAAPPQGAPGLAGTAMFGSPAAPSALPQGAPGLAGTAMFGSPAVSAPPREAPSTVGASALPQGRGTMAFGEALGAGATSLRPAAPAPVSLPPEPRASRHVDVPGDPSAAMRAQLRRRNAFALGVVIAVLVGLGGFAAYRLLPERRPPLPQEALVALRDLRRDDSASKSKAVETLRGVAQANSGNVLAHAWVVVGAALRLDDARIELRRLETEQADLLRRIERLKQERGPGDWESKVNKLIDEMGGLKQESDPLVDGATLLDGELSAAFTELSRLAKAQSRLAVDEELALVRAQAVYAGVKGRDDAIGLSERYRQMLTEQAKKPNAELVEDDGWSAVAFAEYALNARVSPTTRDQARADLVKARQRDSAFIRLYVLDARLAVAQGKQGEGHKLLESVMALNPKHDLARLMSGWVEADRR